MESHFLLPDFALKLEGMSIRKVQTNTNPHEQIIKPSFFSNKPIMVWSLPFSSFPIYSLWRKVVIFFQVAFFLSLLLVFLLVSIPLHFTTNEDQVSLYSTLSFFFGFVMFHCFTVEILNSWLLSLAGPSVLLLCSKLHSWSPFLSRKIHEETTFFRMKSGANRRSWSCWFHLCML